MKTTAPKELGILAVAAVFGLIGGGVALAVFGTGFIAALFVAGLVAVIVAVVLWLGWREPAGRNTQPGLTSKGEPIGADGTARATGADSGSAAHRAGTLPEGARGPGNAPTAQGATTQAASATHGAAAQGASGGQSGSTNTAASATPAPAAAPAAAMPKSTTTPTGDPDARTVHAGAGAAGGLANEVTGSAAATAPAAKPEPAAAPVKAKPATNDAAPAAAAPTEADKPKLLDQAREGGPDNLKEIKGVGPKMETMLHGMGIYHFDQVASWTDKELAWVDSNLEGFKGRASRDNWVSQAKILAAGGETEFSKKVDKGGVY